MSLYTFHLGQIISTVLGQIEHGGQDTSETDHTQNDAFAMVLSAEP